MSHFWEYRKQLRIMSQGQKTDPEVAEAVFAHYCATLNYAETARQFGLPYTTIVRIVNRLSGDEVAELRKARRADMLERVWAKAIACVDDVAPGAFGSKGASPSAEAARAADNLARVAAALTPKETVDVAPPTIVVNTGVPMPPEVAQAGATVTTTLPQGDK